MSKEEEGLKPQDVWLLRSAYLRFERADWRDPEKIKNFLESPELDALVRKGIREGLKEKVKYFKRSELDDKKIVKILREYFLKEIFSEFKPS